MTATPETTGLDVLRAAAHARVKKMTYGVLARNLGIAPDTIVDFAGGNVTLPLPVLDALAKELFGDNVILDAETNLLRSTSPPPRPMGILPPAYDPEKHPAHMPPPAGPWSKGRGGISSVSPRPPARPLTRPGWAM